MRTVRTNLSFGEAVELAKAGRLIARQGWNGKGMFVFIRPEGLVEIDDVQRIQTLPVEVKQFFKTSCEVSVLKFTPYLCMKAADNTIVNGWLASQTDILSNDWCIVTAF